MNALSNYVQLINQLFPRSLPPWQICKRATQPWHLVRQVVNAKSWRMTQMTNETDGIRGCPGDGSPNRREGGLEGRDIYWCLLMFVDVWIGYDMINDWIVFVCVCDINVAGVLYPSARTTAGIRACKGRFKMPKRCCAPRGLRFVFGCDARKNCMQTLGTGLCDWPLRFRRQSLSLKLSFLSSRKFTDNVQGLHECMSKTI